MNARNQLLSLVFLLALPNLSKAHFLWAFADGSDKTLKVQFAESPGEEPLTDFAGKANLVKSLAPKLTLRKDRDGLTAGPLTSVLGFRMDYGIVDRRKEGRGLFLLRYYAKTAPNVKATTANLGLPIELSISIDGTKTVVTVLDHGRPAPGAEIYAHVPGDKDPIQAETNAVGKAALPELRSGRLAIRAQVVRKTKGTMGGKAYDFVRDYGTLVVDMGAQAKADPEAYAALERASSSRQTMPDDISEVTGRFMLKTEAGETAGSFIYQPGRSLSIEGDADAAIVRAQVSSMFSHRRRTPFWDGEGKYPIAFDGPPNGNGRRIALNDDLHSFYRVRDDELTEVDREMGGERFVITILENMRTPENKTLPKVFAVSYFDPKTKTLQRAEYYNDEYILKNGAWLPSARRIVTAKDGKLTAIDLRLIDLEVSRAR